MRIKREKKRKKEKGEVAGGTTSCNTARNTLIVSLLLELSSGGWPATRKVRARVHACLDAVQRAVRCMCTRRDVQPLQRCIADPTCAERLGAPVYRSQRAAQGYHYGGSRHSLLIAGFQRESRPYVRTNERSQLRSLAIIIFSAARKDAHTRTERAQKYAYTHERNIRRIIHAAYSISRTRQ